MDEYRITVVVTDKDHFQKAFEVHPDTKIKSLIIRYYEYLCPKCRFGEWQIQFSYEGKVISPENAIKSIGLRDGDSLALHVLSNGREVSLRSPDSCRPGHSLHYLREPSIVEIPNYEPPKRITVKVLDCFGVAMDITVKENVEVSDVKEAFGKLVRRDTVGMLLHSDGKVVDEYETLRVNGIVHGGTIDVSYEGLSDA